jgi:hypothetical protein
MTEVRTLQYVSAFFLLHYFLILLSFRLKSTVWGFGDVSSLNSRLAKSYEILEAQLKIIDEGLDSCFDHVNRQISTSLLVLMKASTFTAVIGRCSKVMQEGINLILMLDDFRL